MAITLTAGGSVPVTVVAMEPVPLITLFLNWGIECVATRYVAGAPVRAVGILVSGDASVPIAHRSAGM